MWRIDEGVEMPVGVLAVLLGVVLHTVGAAFSPRQSWSAFGGVVAAGASFPLGRMDREHRRCDRYR